MHGAYTLITCMQEQSGTQLGAMQSTEAALLSAIRVNSRKRAQKTETLEREVSHGYACRLELVDFIDQEFVAVLVLRCKSTAKHLRGCQCEDRAARAVR